MSLITGRFFNPAVLLFIFYIYPCGQNVLADDSLARFEKFPTRTVSHQSPFSIPFMLDKAAREIQLDIYSPDNDIVRSLIEKKALHTGRHSIHWDGKDKRGVPVPNEAYTPVLTVTFSDQTRLTIDPRNKQQPAFFTPSNIELIDNRHVSYTLDKPARVQVRAGIENGPMIHEIESWIPRDNGKYIAEWNGFDENGITSFINHPELILSVSAYALHENIILVTGNDNVNYRSYYRKNYPKKSQEFFTKENIKQNESLPVLPSFLDPKVKLHLFTEGKQEILPSTKLTISKPTVLHVRLDPENEWMLNNGKFEVGFFVDYVFSSEAEQYFQPIAWILYPDQFSSGEHILSININGPYGSVATRHLKFSIP